MTNTDAQIARADGGKFAGPNMFRDLLTRLLENYGQGEAKNAPWRQFIDGVLAPVV